MKSISVKARLYCCNNCHAQVDVVYTNREIREVLTKRDALKKESFVCWDCFQKLRGKGDKNAI